MSVSTLDLDYKIRLFFFLNVIHLWHKQNLRPDTVSESSMSYPESMGFCSAGAHPLSKKPEDSGDEIASQ